LGGKDGIFSGEMGITTIEKLEDKQWRSDLLHVVAQWLVKGHGQGQILDAMGLR